MCFFKTNWRNRFKVVFRISQCLYLVCIFLSMQAVFLCLMLWENSFFLWKIKCWWISFCEWWIGILCADHDFRFSRIFFYGFICFCSAENFGCFSSLKLYEVYFKTSLWILITKILPRQFQITLPPNKSLSSTSIKKNQKKIPMRTINSNFSSNYDWIIAYKKFWQRTFWFTQFTR